MPSTLLLLLATLGARQDGPAPRDLVIYGGTSAGIAAAVQAKKLGLDVVVVAPEKHLGGLTSGGLGWTDFGRKEAVGGLALEFYKKLKQHYDRPEAWRQQEAASFPLYKKDEPAIWAFEPHVAEAAFEDWVREHGIEVVREARLDRSKGVEVEDGRIRSITTLNGKTFAGKVFMDATYEGDLMAAAGVSYTVGREANSQYNETFNGVQTKNARSHQFDHPVDPYLKPGNPSSGLLPRVHDGDPGTDGEADQRIQAYCFRMCLTDDPGNRVPFEKPEGYDPLQYELLARYLATGWDQVFRKFDPIPNRKTDTNNHGGFSTDNIGMNYDYPEATYERREEIIREHEQYQKGLMYFLANDPRVPEKIRAKAAGYGLAADEFKDNGHWPHQIYVREARRMVSDFVMGERHLRGLDPTPEPIGMGSYNMDSHNVQRYVDENCHARNEGDIQVNPGGPYPISYRAIVPKEGECENLLVPVCLSSTHIAYGSIRMEPVFMVLGQSAATAAAIAVEEGVAVRDVPYEKLRSLLERDGQVLHLPRVAEATRARLVNPASIGGIVVDDTQAEFRGDWGESHVVGPYVGGGYRHDAAEAKGEKTAAFRATLEPGRYEVLLFYPSGPNRATSVPVTVRHTGGEQVIRVDQTMGGELSKLGSFEFGTEGLVEFGTAGTDGHVIADAVVFRREG
jgi:hypothetical protein